MLLRSTLPLCAVALASLLAATSPSDAQNSASPTPSRNPASPMPPHPALPGPVVPDGLGVNIHFTDAKPGEMKMIAEGGFKWIRMDLGWAHTERELGQYDFSAFDRLLKSLDEHKIRPLLILDYGNRLYNPGGGSGHPDTDAAHTPAFRRGYANWAAAAAKHFAGRGVVWEIWNEPNISGFWKPRPNVADYAAMALEACKAIRAVAPNECIIGPASSTMDMAFLEACFQAGLLNWWDAVSVHPYRQSAPETASEEYRKLRQLIDKYKPAGKSIPIISGEWGYSAAWNGYDEISQGKMLPRQWLTNLMNDVPLSIWYDWHDDGTDPKEPEHHFGTVANKYFDGRNPIYDPKPAYRAAQTFTDQLQGMRFSKRLWTGNDNDYLLLFESVDANGNLKAREPRMAAWTTNKSGRISIPGGNFSISNEDANRKWKGSGKGLYYVAGHIDIPKRDEEPPLATGDDWKLDLSLSDAPQYASTSQFVYSYQPEDTVSADTGARLRGTPEERNDSNTANDVWRVAAAWERAPSDLSVRGGQVFSLPLTLRNPLPQALEITGPTRHTLQPGESTAIPYSIRLMRDDEPMQLISKLRLSDKVLWQQMTRIHITNPLRLGLFLRDENAPVLQLENPSGEAFVGTLRFRTHNRNIDLPVAMPNGQTALVMGIPMAARSTLEGQLAILDAKSAPMIRPRSLRLRALELWSLANAARNHSVLPDGDAAVRSTQSITAAPSPAPLLGATAPTLKLDYAFEVGWKFVRIVPQNDAAKLLEGKPTALQMWVYGDGSGNHARMRFADESGQTFQPNGEAVNWNGWKLVTFPLDGSLSGYWGGANNGQVQGKIRIDSLFLLDSASRQPSKGTIHIATPTLLYTLPDTP
ncbi:MAG: polysaccharide biosynthesis protein PslG [Abditibacteriota bacterium]|nr:polysaccharide biosynthesis protein PslG [Abditibacteriota bacterium]